MENYYRARQAADDNMTRVHCLLDTQGYNDSFRVCNSYCFSTATIVAQMYNVMCTLPFLSEIPLSIYHDIPQVGHDCSTSSQFIIY